MGQRAQRGKVTRAGFSSQGLNFSASSIEVTPGYGASHAGLRLDAVMLKDLELTCSKSPGEEQPSPRPQLTLGTGPQPLQRPLETKLWTARRWDNSPWPLHCPPGVKMQGREAWGPGGLGEPASTSTPTLTSTPIPTPGGGKCFSRKEQAVLRPQNDPPSLDVTNGAATGLRSSRVQLFEA